MIVVIFIILWLYMPAYFLTYLIQETVGLDLFSVTVCTEVDILQSQAASWTVPWCKYQGLQRIYKQLQGRRRSTSSFRIALRQSSKMLFYPVRVFPTSASSYWRDPNLPQSSSNLQALIFPRSMPTSQYTLEVEGYSSWPNSQHHASSCHHQIGYTL